MGKRRSRVRSHRQTNVEKTGFIIDFIISPPKDVVDLSTSVLFALQPVNHFILIDARYLRQALLTTNFTMVGCRTCSGIS